MTDQEILNIIIRIATAIQSAPADTPPPQTERHVIVRGDRSGVFYGRLLGRDGQEVTLGDARHIWYWAGAANTAEIANSGVSRPGECKIVAPVSEILILDAIEVLDCTDAAVKSLDLVPYWSKQ